MHYHIVVRGELSDRFASAFGSVAVHVIEGETCIKSDLLDESQLHRVLARLSNLGIEVISITPAVEDPGVPG